MLINFAVITNGGPVAAAPGPPPSWRKSSFNSEHDPKYKYLNHFTAIMAAQGRRYIRGAPSLRKMVFFALILF